MSIKQQFDVDAVNAIAFNLLADHFRDGNADCYLDAADLASRVIAWDDKALAHMREKAGLEPDADIEPHEQSDSLAIGFRLGLEVALLIAANPLGRPDISKLVSVAIKQYLYDMQYRDAQGL